MMTVRDKKLAKENQNDYKMITKTINTYLKMEDLSWNMICL